MKALIRDALDERFIGQRVEVMREVSKAEKEEMFSPEFQGKRFFWVRWNISHAVFTIWKAAEELEFLPEGA